MLTHRRKDGHVGGGIAEDGAFVPQQFHHFHGGGFAHVVDVLFVGDTLDEDASTFVGLTTVVEGVGHLADHPLGHVGVDFPSEFDEAGAEAVFACPIGDFATDEHG